MIVFFCFGLKLGCYCVCFFFNLYLGFVFLDLGRGMLCLMVTLCVSWLVLFYNTLRLMFLFKVLQVFLPVVSLFSGDFVFVFSV